MGSNPSSWVLTCGLCLLAAAAFCAGASFHAGGGNVTGLVVASAAGMVLAIGLIRRGCNIQRRVDVAAPMERPASVPHDHAALSARVLALETQLEYAPIALFRISEGDSARPCEPANANARRLLAPGRAADAEALGRMLAGLAAGQRSVTEFETERGSERALAIVGAVTVDGKPQRLVALMPVENELEAEAMQAWQKLVHVLTHEIMNSLTPVASLSQTSRELLAGERGKLPADIASDLDIALDAIWRRADSLTHFVSGYRSLASVPEAQRQPVVVASMFARLAALVEPAWQARGGRAIFTVEPDALELLADPGQLEQALMNLIQNAAEACAGQALAEVQISARLTRGARLRIEVCDNGPGVSDELIKDIFTPFFSTKARGSGIGLAMVRQLVHRNGGAVRYAKSIGGGARFVLTF